MEFKQKPPTSFWIIAGAAIIWNLIEIYFSSIELDFIESNATAEEFQSMQSLPIWYTVVFLAGLFAETLGSFMLFMRKKIATKLFALAIITLLFVELYWLFTFDIAKTSIVFSVVIPIVVIAIALFLYFYSKSATTKGWLK